MSVKALTINDLAELCAEQQRKGYGDKKILISNDDEGNGYHELFYEFSNPREVFKGNYPPSKPCHLGDAEIRADYIILG